MKEYSNTLSIKKLRKEQYDHHGKVMPYLSDWRKNPYTFLKAKFYMEMSAILVYYLIKLKVKPNTVTILYAMCGIIGGLLFSLPYKGCVLFALLIFFVKAVALERENSLRT